MISVFRIIDSYIGGMLCFLLGFFSFKHHSGRHFERPFEWPKKILVVRLWTLGESILTLPMVEVLAQKYPRAEIEVLVLAESAASVFKPFHFVKRIIRLRVGSLAGLFFSPRKYDLVVDTEPYFKISALLTFWLGKTRLGYDHGVRARLYNFRARYDDQIHAAENLVGLLRPLGIEEKISRLVPFPKNEEASVVIKEFLKSQGLMEKKLIALHAGTAGTASYRAWPAENFARLIDLLAHHYPDSHFLLNGSRAEKNLNEEIKSDSLYSERITNIAGRFKLPEVWELYRHLDLFISNDTGPMHAAAAQWVKTIGLFGPNLPLRFGPYPPRNNAGIYYGSRFSPCVNVQKGDFKRCPCNGECMRRISPETVFAEAAKMLQA